MKRCISMFLAVLLLATCFLMAPPTVEAAQKKDVSRTIAILFDNSGSMYVKGNLAWCRATYAMEVFASMLNPGDTLLIYPMNEIQVGGKKYTMERPYRITDATQSSTIRQIGTTWPGPTPIESVDYAFEGIKKEAANEKYLIILSDGTYFTQFTEPPVVESEKKYVDFSPAETKKELDKRIQANMGPNLTVMYLGMDTPDANGKGDKAIMPDTKESAYFMKRRAEKSTDVLAVLTEMCNMIFGRDILPKNHKSDKELDIDISLSQLIVFVQGENISDLKVVGPSGSSPTLKSTSQVRYAEPTVGCLDRYVDQTKTDTSLQGMMVTYGDLDAGKYTIDYKGTASSVEVYYLPNADLDFVFTDAMGNTVDPNALYEGDYKISYGMKDGKTGKLIESDLLGNPKYQGSYTINGETKTFEHEGYSGEISVPLAMNDAFKADLTVTYLSGYTISKDSSDFGWPEGGIKVAARPAGELTLKITGGEELYSLQDLDEGAPYIAEVYHQGEKLTGKDLESVELKWDPDTSNAEITQEFAKDHYLLHLQYKDPENPKETKPGECTVDIHAFYTAKGSDQSQTKSPLTYNIDDDFSPLQMELVVVDDYIVISQLEKSQPITVNLTLDGAKLTEEEFAALKTPVVQCDIPYELIPNPQRSSYQIKLKPGDGVQKGDYLIAVIAEHTDQIGRTTSVDEEALISLRMMPIWLKWIIILLCILLLILIIWLIMHIPAMPKNVRHQNNDCILSIGGIAVADGVTFKARRDGKTLKAEMNYGGNTAGVKIADLVPGPGSYVSTPNKKRSMLVKNVNAVRVVGEITNVDINGVAYTLNRDGKLVPDDDQQKPFKIANNCVVTFEGKMNLQGKVKKFHAEIPLTFKKK